MAVGEGPILTFNRKYEITVFCFAGNQLGLNVMHMVAGEPVAPGATVGDLARNLGLLLGPLYKAAMPSVAEYRAVGVRPLTIPTSGQFLDSVSAGVGSNGDELLPCQVAGIFTKRTAFAGKKNRGRAYVPFPSTLSSASTVNPVPTLAYTALVQDIGTACAGDRVITGVGGGTVTMTWGLYHRETGTIDVITQNIARRAFATQRRRGNYGRSNNAPVV